MKPIPLTEDTNHCYRSREERRERTKMWVTLVVTFVAFALDAWLLL